MIAIFFRSLAKLWRTPCFLANAGAGGGIFLAALDDWLSFWHSGWPDSCERPQTVL
jgi:hypothetical protein